MKELESYVADPNACVKKLEWTDMVSVLPKYLGDIREGVRTCLSQKIGTYDRKVDGIILAYKNTKILSPLSAIHPNSVRVYVKTRADFYVFRPQSGSIIGGTVQYVSSNYLSAVIYRVFNVTIKLKTQKIQNIARGKEISFVIKSYDMKSDLPSIEGELIGEQPHLNGSIKSEARQNGGTTRIKSTTGSDESEDGEHETQCQTTEKERDQKSPSPVTTKVPKRKKVKLEPQPIEEESVDVEMDSSIRAILSVYEDELNDSNKTNGTSGTLPADAVDAPGSSKKKKKRKRKSQDIDTLEAELLQKFAAQCDEPDAVGEITNGHTNGDEASAEPVTPKAEKLPKRKKKKRSNLDSDADEFEASIMSSLLKCAAEAEESLVGADATPFRKVDKKSRKSVRFDDTIMEASFNSFDTSEQLEISQLPAPNLSSTLK